MMMLLLLVVVVVVLHVRGKSCLQHMN